MGLFSKVTGGALDFISDPLADAGDTISQNWVDLRDTAEAAAVVAGNYFLPGSSILTSKLVTGGAQDKLNTDLGRVANVAAGAAGGIQGNAANYGKVAEAAGVTSGASNAGSLTADQLATANATSDPLAAANAMKGWTTSDVSYLKSIGATADLISVAEANNARLAGTSLTPNQIAQLAKAGVALAGVAGAASAVGGGDTGGFGLAQQDRSGFSSGSANYSPEYYAAIQNKYNQYMPQAKGADITTDLKNWYETKYTPNASVAANPTTGTTGTGYTTPTTMANLGIKPQVVAPSYSILNPRSSTDVNVATEYAKYIEANGGNTPENRAAAIQYLQTKGFSGPQIDAAYNQYLGTLPASTGTTAETMAANATPAQIAQAYAGYAAANGGDNQTNQAAAIQYLQKIGVPYATIEAAYPIFKSTYGQASVAAPTTTGGGMLTGGTQTQAAPAAQAPAAQASQPSYTSLSGNSSPAAIAAAYRDYVASAGGDTQANQAAAQNYLANLGVSPDTVNQAYGLFKG